MSDKKKDKNEIQVKFLAKNNEKKEFEKLQKTTISSNDAQLIRNLVFGIGAVLRPTSLLKLTSHLGGTVFKEKVDHINGREEIDFTMLKALGLAIRKDIFGEELDGYNITLDDLESIKEGTKELIDRDDLEVLIASKLDNVQTVGDKVLPKKQKEDIYGMEVLEKKCSEFEVKRLHKYIISALGKEVCYRFSPQGGVDYIVPAILYKKAPPANANGTIKKMKICDEVYKIYFYNPVSGKIESQDKEFPTLLYKLVDFMGMPFTEYGLRLSYKHAVTLKRKTVICTMDVHEGILLNTYYKMGTRAKRLSHLNVIAYDTTNIDYARYGNDYYSMGDMAKFLKSSYDMVTSQIEGTNPYVAAVQLLRRLVRDNLDILLINKQIDKRIVKHYSFPESTYASLIYGK